MEINMKNYLIFALLILFGFSIQAMDAPLPEMPSIAMSHFCFEKILKVSPHLANSQDRFGKTLLVQAIEIQNLSKVNLLMRANANPWIKDKKGECAMHAVGKLGNLAIARKIIQNHRKDQEWKEINALGEGQTPFLYARNNKHQACAIFLWNFDRSEDPLFQALMFGNLEKIDELIDDTVKANQAVQADFGVDTTPLMWATYLEDEKLVKYLLSRGARVTKRDPIGISPWESAHNVPQIKKVMQKHDNACQIQDDFMRAVSVGEVKTIKYYLEGNRKRLSSINFIRCPVSIAIQAGKLESVKILWPQMFNGFLVLGDPQQLFLEACLKGNKEIINFIGSQKNVDLNFGLSKGLWPFNYNISEETKNALLALFDLHERGFDERNPQEYIVHAARYRRKALIDRGLALGANINGYNSKGLIALHWACIKGAPNCMAHMLNKGANPNIPDRIKKRSCFRLTLRMHDLSPKKDEEQLPTSALLPCFFLLMCNGAEPRIPDINGQDVFYWINRQGFHQEIKTLLVDILHLNDKSSEGSLNARRRAILHRILDQQKIESLMASSAKNFTKAQHIKDLLISEDNKWKILKKDKFKDIYEKYLD